MTVKFARASAGAIPIHFTDKAAWPALRDSLPESVRAFAALHGFSGEPGALLVAPTPDKPGFMVVFATAGADAVEEDPLLAGKLAAGLPAGDYRFANEPPAGGRALELAALAWLLASYRFSRYRTSAGAFPRLVAPAGLDKAKVLRLAGSVHLARDLINTPANDMGVPALTAAARAVARECGARVQVVAGAQLLKRNFPLIHAVGRAGADAPALVDLQWGRARAPKVTLVGKGVCFDTGGLDIKPSAAMLLMKKDMAGAAIALGLARAVMLGKLDVRLRLLLPIVENAVAGNAFRPGDVYPSRKGLTVEIGNTDAEGRLILADALALGDEEAPDLMLDFATLTGAARVATGPDLPPFFCDDEAVAADLMRRGAAIGDPVWRLPLWRPYGSMLASKIADTNNVSSGPFAGSITAALFLKRFVSAAKTWAHFDVYGWNASDKPARPAGGEAQTLRLIYEFLADRYGTR